MNSSLAAGFTLFFAVVTPICVSAAALQQAYVKPFNPGTPDSFGQSLAISGDTLVVAAPIEASSVGGINGPGTDNGALRAGAAYVFVRQGTNWIQQAYLKASNAETGDVFGIWVAISGDTIVVGAYNEDSDARTVNGNATNNAARDAGAAYVFVREGTNWSQQAYLKASNADVGDLFGASVGTSGDTIVVGAQNERSSATGVDGNAADNSYNNAGAAYVFVRSGTNWTQQAYLKPAYLRPPSSSAIHFGRAAAILGDTIVIGALGDDSGATGVNGDPTDTSATNSGAAYVFVRNGTNWSQQAYLKASNPEFRDSFGGLAVTISGDTVVVGANREDSSATRVNGDQSNNSAVDSGAAYVFVRNGTNWSQQAYLKASNTGAGDRFGISVAASGNIIVVGADQESSDAAGVNGDQTNNNAFFSGAAYVFVRDGTNWFQQAYLKASNPDESDTFGYWVGVSGGTVVIGAAGEDGSANTINGLPDDGILNSGAAYVFTGLGINPPLVILSDGSGGYYIRFQAPLGSTYEIERAVSIPGVWETLATRTSDASGFVEFHDTAPLAGQAFYRSRATQ